MLLLCSKWPMCSILKSKQVLLWKVMLFDLVSSLEDKEYVDVDVVVDVIVIGEASSLRS